jgi:hypothetical protein
MKKKSYKSFEELDCWKACREVRKFVYELVKKYPKEELYGLVQDMRRAARSTTHKYSRRIWQIPLPGEHSISPSQPRFSSRTRDQLIISLDEEYITQEEYEEGRTLTGRSIAPVNGYINYL